MNTLSKIRLLFRLLPCHPVEFWDRATAVLSVQWDRKRSALPRYQTIGVSDCLHPLQEILAADFEQIESEHALQEIQEQVVNGLTEVGSNGSFPLTHNADLDLARCCYSTCRALMPDVVVETGVAYGITSGFVLKALAVNGRGELWSVDLPPLGRNADEHVGILVPHELRSRWHLHRGASKRVLPRLLPSLANVNVFIHDSLHTYVNMKSEFEAVWPFLQPAGILIADDVGQNCAFQDFVHSVNPTFWATVKESSKSSLFGIAVKGK